MVEEDPLSIVYDGVWELVDNFAPFKDQFRPGNIIRLNDPNNPDPLKNNIQTADLPEVILVFSGGSGNTHSTSSQSQMGQQFDFLISTGQKRVGLTSALKWHAFQCVYHWRESLAGLTYRGETFVTSLDWLGVLEGMSDPQNNRGILGWSSVVSIKCEMTFSRNQMKRVL